MAEPQAPSWPDLLHPLLELILEHLPFADYLRFPAVCSSWRTVQHEHRLRHAASPRYQRQMPWMLLSDLKSNKTLYNPSEKRYYRISFPTNDFYYPIAKDGWFMAATCTSFLLVNIFAGFQTHIPFPPIDYEKERVQFRADLTSIPTDPKCILLCQFLGEDSMHYIYRFKDKKWVTIKGRPLATFQRPAISGGKFYEFHSFAAEVLFETVSVPVPRFTHFTMDKEQVGTVEDTLEGNFLVECDGDILLVREVGNKFQAFKADLRNKVWVKVDSLADKVLFLSHRGHTFSLSAADIGGPGNRIYYDALWDKQKDGMLTEYNYGAHKFESSRFQNPVKNPAERVWIIRNIDWIVPILL